MAAMMARWWAMLTVGWMERELVEGWVYWLVVLWGTGMAVLMVVLMVVCWVGG